MTAERLSVFPAFHKVSGRPVLVVGEGAEAVAKVRLLGETEAEIRLVAASPSPELQTLLVGTGIEHRPREFRPEDLDGAMLAFAASGDRARDEGVVAAARARGIPVNAVDLPDLCDFYTPAIVNRAPVAVAITSTGAGPVLAQKLRARIEAMLPARLGALARLAEGFRAPAERLPKGQPRRRFWSAFFEGRVADAALAGLAGEAERLAGRLLSTADAGERGFVWLVGAGPGAADLLTLRAQRILQEADVIVHDGLVPEAVIAMGRRDAERIDVGRTQSQAELNHFLVREAHAGRRVVRLSLGDPLLVGRAGEEMLALRNARIPFEVVPGIVPQLAAAAEAEIPLSLPGTASILISLMEHDATDDLLPGWVAQVSAGATLAIQLGRSAPQPIVKRLIEAGLPANTPATLVRNPTLPERRLFAGTLGDLHAFSGRDDVAGPAVVLIGRAAADGALSLAASAAPVRIRAA